jgi:Putative exporter of polyketide antibiotics
MQSNKFQKTVFLTRFNFKRDWSKLLLWAVVLIGLFVGVASKFTSLYGDKASIDQIIKTLKSPAMVSLFGKMPAGPYTSADVFRFRNDCLYGYRFSNHELLFRHS